MNAALPAGHLGRVVLLLLSLALASGSAHAAPTLRVRAPGADPQRFATALLARLPTVAVRAEGEPAPGDVLTTLEARGPGWQLAVRDASGALLLERSFPEGAAPFDASALVVERFLVEIHWQGRPAAIQPAELAPQQVAIPPLPPSTSWSLGVGAVGAAGALPGDLRGGPVVQVSYRRERWLLGARVHVLLPRTRSVLGAEGAVLGAVHDLSASAAVQGGACLGRTWSGCAGVLLGVRTRWAWARGEDLYQARTRAGASFAGGLFASGARRFGPGLEAGLQLAAAGHAGDAGDAIEGAQGAAFRPSRLELSLAALILKRLP